MATVISVLILIIRLQYFLINVSRQSPNSNCPRNWMAREQLSIKENTGLAPVKATRHSTLSIIQHILITVNHTRFNVTFSAVSESMKCLMYLFDLFHAVRSRWRMRPPTSFHQTFDLPYTDSPFPFPLFITQRAFLVIADVVTLFYPTLLPFFGSNTHLVKHSGWDFPQRVDRRSFRSL